MSRNSDYFKKIQLSLFDFLNVNKVKETYKDKDLLGPLKYLDAKSPEEEREPVHSPSQSTTNLHGHPQQDVLTSPKDINSKLAEKFFQDISVTNKYSDFVLDMPLVVHRKPYLRHIRFYVKPNSTLHVVAPLNRSLDLIKKEISEHKDWVQKCDQKFQALRAKFPMKKFSSGERFPLLGEDFVLKLEPADFKKPFIQTDLDQLIYFYPESWDQKPKPEKQELLKKHLKKFYHDMAVSHLNQRVRTLSESTQLFPKRLTFRNQKTRWGSCSSDGSLNLNWKLIAFDPSLIDYVVIHELCHIKHPNHSKRFWTLVESFCPEYKIHNKQLNKLQFEADFLAAESELYFSNPSIV